MEIGTHQQVFGAAAGGGTGMALMFGVLSTMPPGTFPSKQSALSMAGALTLGGAVGGVAAGAVLPDEGPVSAGTKLLAFGAGAGAAALTTASAMGVIGHGVGRTGAFVATGAALGTATGLAAAMLALGVTPGTQ